MSAQDFPVKDLVDDPIAALANAVAVPADQLLATRRPWVGYQAVDASQDPRHVGGTMKCGGAKDTTITFTALLKN